MFALYRRVRDLKDVKDTHGDVLHQVGQCAGHADEPHLPGLSELQERIERAVFFESSLRWRGMKLDDVEIVGLHAGKALFDPRHDIVAGEDVLPPLSARRRRCLYDRDALNDELPYWTTIGATSHLIIPYSFETNDNRFDQNHGFSTGGDFARYMIDCFEVIYEEGAEHPKLMSLALHDRLTGRPGRITGLVKFLDHIIGRDRVWICTGREIAEHWRRVPLHH